LRRHHGKGDRRRLPARGGRHGRGRRTRGGRPERHLRAARIQRSWSECDQTTRLPAVPGSR
jgi:hypothetical protein